MFTLINFFFNYRCSWMQTEPKESLWRGAIRIGSSHLRARCRSRKYNIPMAVQLIRKKSRYWNICDVGKQKHCNVLAEFWRWLWVRDMLGEQRCRKAKRTLCLYRHTRRLVRKYAFVFLIFLFCFWVWNSGKKNAQIKSWYFPLKLEYYKQEATTPQIFDIIDQKG